MFEMFQSISIYLVNSIAGGIYVQKFFKEKYPKKISIFAWMFLYFANQYIIKDILKDTHLFNDIVNVIEEIVIVLLLQMLLYYKNFYKQLFAAVSFVAGKEIIKYFITVLNYSQYWINSKLIMVFYGKITTMEKAKMWNFISNGIIWFIVILSYALFMILNFSMISRKFIRNDFRLQKYEYAFLLLPNVSTLCIAIT